MYEYFLTVIGFGIIGVALIMLPKNENINENSDERDYYISYDGDLVWL